METVRRKVQTVELLLRQIEAAEAQVTVTNYHREMARAIPTTSANLAEDLKQKTDDAEWYLETSLSVIPRMLGVHTLDEVRGLHYALVSTFNAYVEARQELSYLEATLEPMKAVREEHPNEEKNELLDRKLSEFVELKRYVQLLEKEAKSRADKIDLVGPSGRVTLL